MLGNRIATFIRIAPPLKTITESTAVLKRMKEFGKVTSFVRAPYDRPVARSSELQAEDSPTSLYFAVLTSTSPTGIALSNFNVPVYHDIIDPKDEDPFDIRGLQDRKPWPDALTFDCTVEVLNAEQQQQIEADLKNSNPYHDRFATKPEKFDSLQRVLRDTNAPPRVIEGLGRLTGKNQKYINWKRKSIAKGDLFDMDEGRTERAVDETPDLPKKLLPFEPNHLRRDLEEESTRDPPKVYRSLHAEKVS